MRRALAVMMLLATVSAHAAEKWWDAYKRGVAAISAHNYEAGIEAIQHAVAEMPMESTAARARNETIVYLPHFWIGLAKLNSGDTDGALRELRISEEQGAIQNTENYTRLREAVSRASADKARAAQSGVADVRKAADGAVSKAMSTQMDALAAGADRSDGYRAGQRKLQEAMQQFKSAGGDARAYQHASEAASAASELFASAAEEARRAKAARPATPPPAAAKPKPVVSAPVAPVDVAHLEVPPKPVPQPVVAAQPPPVPVESEALVSARVALQQLRQRVTVSADAKSRAIASGAAKLDGDLRAHPDEATIQSVATFVETKQRELDQPVSKSDLTLAYRAYARGEIAKSLSLLTSMIDSRPSAEAFLLRGCAKYTAAMMTGKPDLAAASADFKAALKLNRGVRLDRQTFSPKLVAYFEGLR